MKTELAIHYAHTIARLVKEGNGADAAQILLLVDSIARCAGQAEERTRVMREYKILGAQ